MRASSRPEGKLLLEKVRFADGHGDIGDWGCLILNGQSSAVVQSRVGEDINLPSQLARSLLWDDVILNSEIGSFVVLPYERDVVAQIKVPVGEVFELASIQRAADRGMRVAGFKFVPTGGLVFICEGCLIFLDEVFDLKWQIDEDFSSWSIAGIDDRELLLVSSSPSDEETFQRRSMLDGSVIWITA
jgi:hypothetical protein